MLVIVSQSIYIYSYRNWKWERKARVLLAVVIVSTVAPEEQRKAKVNATFVGTGDYRKE